MTFDPERIAVEHGLLVDRLENQVELWREYAADDDMREPAARAYRDCASRLEKILEEHD